MTNATKDQHPRGIVTAVHCQACGSTRREDVGHDALREREGYTACCNERAIYPGTDVFGRPTRCDDDCSHD